ncbi:MBL fold metallo-hydrolase [Alkalicoccus luteus]|uniref:MBL fold metallo-hydrolase n=1 Tax=Alkalicoccus luteus TaxID=1237094 RepID=A0A969TWM5_9BACI|nr:MBL fold metallo-hydrolase [Alkalicoccus luteus]NJP39382.1 MBL fold metallo-hydrolase [Alkalicoccus luteus]
MQIASKTSQVERIIIPTPFLVGDVNVYLISGDVNILIDTGPDTPEAKQALLKGLQARGLQPDDIDFLILTHHHPDHIGLAGMFTGKTKTAGHPLLKPWLEKDEALYEHIESFFRPFFKTHGMKPEVIEQIVHQQKRYRDYVQPAEMMEELEETVEASMLPGWTVVETPGHASTHISLLREEDGLLVAGDHVIKHISSNAIIEAPSLSSTVRPRTLLDYRQSLKKCAGAALIYSGHGDMITEPRTLIEKRLTAQLQKADMFLSKLHEPMTVAALTKLVYGSMFAKQPDLTFSETLGHLDLLEEQGRVNVWNDGENVVYESLRI